MNKGYNACKQAPERRRVRSALAVIVQAWRLSIRRFLGTFVIASILYFTGPVIIELSLTTGTAAFRLAVDYWVGELCAAFALLAALLLWISLSCWRDAGERRQPGAHILEIAERFMSDGVYCRVIRPAVEDLQDEYNRFMDQGERAAAFLVTFRYRWAICGALALCLLTAAMRSAVHLVWRKPPV